jgi:hypothetical protein
MTILLKNEGDSNVYPVHIMAAERGKWGQVSIQAGPVFVQLAAEQKELYEFFHKLADEFKARTVAQVINDISPADVIAYFEASPVLAEMAADVRAVLEPLVRAQPAGQVAADVEKLRPFIDELLPAGQPARGHTRRAARILFGDESLNGGANLTRIRKAIQELEKFTTTTVQNEENSPDVVELAA